MGRQLTEKDSRHAALCTDVIFELKPEFLPECSHRSVTSSSLEAPNPKPKTQNLVLHPLPPQKNPLLL